MAPDPVDEFELLAGERTDTLRVQRSEFVAFAFPASTEEMLRERLDDIGREHHASRHLCWGHRFLGSDWSLIEKSSDAGEPSGTAGQPILNAIRGAGLVDSAVVVVRYFGGVKLGTGGLVRAYGDSAAAVLDGAPRKRRLRRSNVEISTSFSAMNEIYRLADPPDVEIIEEEFGENVRFLLAVRDSRLEAVIALLRELRIDTEIARR